MSIYPNSTSGWQLLVILALLLLQSACASKIPPSIPLPESEKPFVLNRLQEFQDCRRNTSLDADVTLEWQGYGKAEKFPGMLQLQSPSFLRYAIVDPLGRQLLILVSDGSQFTLVNNHKASAFVGVVNSSFWQQYIPDYLAPIDYIRWLTGRLPAIGFEIDEIRQEKEPGKGIWLITKWDGAIRHRVHFELENSRILRHMVEGRDKDILLDILYTNYSPTNDDECAKPHQLTVEGADISGSLIIRFDEIFPEALISEDIFQLSIPDHFTVEPVE